MTDNTKPIAGKYPVGQSSEPKMEPTPKSKAAKSSGPWGEIQQIEASGQTFAEATQIEANSPWTVVAVLAKDHQAAVGKKAAMGPQQGVILPVGAAIGDLVELYFTGYTGRVFTAEGDSLSYTDENASVDVGSSAMFRKVTEKGWRYMAGA
jgi:hypothetical protein